MPAHPLSAIAAGSRVLLDANIFIYAFTGRSLQCREVIERPQDGEARAVRTPRTSSEIRVWPAYERFADRRRSSRTSDRQPRDKRPGL